MTKIICAPGSYIQGAGEIKKLASYYQELGTKGAYMMIGHHAYVHDLDDIESSFKEANVPFTSALFGGECSREEVEKHQNISLPFDSVKLVFHCQTKSLPLTSGS